VDEEQIKRIIMEKQSDHRISCKVACEIAEQAGVPPRRIGRLLDEMKIKIHACQLGCFD
jgi:hypothetical protein